MEETIHLISFLSLLELGFFSCSTTDISFLQIKKNYSIILTNYIFKNGIAYIKVGQFSYKLVFGKI